MGAELIDGELEDLDIQSNLCSMRVLVKTETEIVQLWDYFNNQLEFACHYTDYGIAKTFWCTSSNKRLDSRRTVHEVFDAEGNSLTLARSLDVIHTALKSPLPYERLRAERLMQPLCAWPDLRCPLRVTDTSAIYCARHLAVLARRTKEVQS